MMKSLCVSLNSADQVQDFVNIMNKIDIIGLWTRG